MSTVDKKMIDELIDLKIEVEETLKRIEELIDKCDGMLEE